MKNQTLSIEQMKYLKDLGVDTSKASMVCLFIDENCNEIDWGTVENHGKDKPLYEWYDDEYGHWVEANPEYFAAESGTYDHSNRESCGVFTLQDMLEMMPKCIINHGIDYNFSIYGNFVSYSHFENGNHKHDLVFVKCKYGLLEEIYQVLCWLAENGHLKGGIASYGLQ